MFKQRFLLILMIGLAAACGDDDDASGPSKNDPVFEATVAGDYEADLEGKAYFGSDKDDDGEDIFAIALGVDDASIALATAGKTRPAPGVYEIVDGVDADDFAAGEWVAIFTFEEGNAVGYFVSTGGSIDIDVSNDDRIKGSFTFDAVGFLTDDLETILEITVEGTFDATEADVSAVAISPAARTLAPVR
jgi:hypothetical protein